MAYNSFTDSDKQTLLNNPGVLSTRAYGSSDPFVSAVFANGAAFSKAVETAEILFDDVGVVEEQVAKETVELSLSSGRVLDLDFIASVSGGQMTVSNTSGDPVTGATLAVTSGNWNFNKLIYIPNQNASGAKQTIASVVGSVDGALSEAVDYDQVKLPEIGWGIMVKDSSKVTTENQTITVTYGYTPAAVKKLSTGGFKSITPIEVKYETIDSSGKAVVYYFYKVYPSGEFGHGFGAEEKAEPITMDLKFTAKVDTTRTAGDQLFSVSRTM